MNNKVERGKGESFVTTRMRQRSCHFCECCMRLDPTNRVEGGSNPCKFSALCGDPDNVLIMSLWFGGKSYMGLKLEAVT